MWPNSQGTADLVTFTQEILNGKLHFLCSVMLFLENFICNNFRRLFISNYYFSDYSIYYDTKQNAILNPSLISIFHYIIDH